MTLLPRILILEDSVDRITRMDELLVGIATPRFARTAHEFIGIAAESLKLIAAISLDHDLYVPKGDPDPGDGVDAARFLSSLAPTCSVIVHSSNVTRAYEMIGHLENSGWTTHRVGAIGRDWIEADWVPTVRKAIDDWNSCSRASS